MSVAVQLTRSKKHRVLIVVANPAVSPTVGPVGFWASELTHAWYEFTEVGYEVELASPRGGRVEPDALSDPRHPSGYSAHDLVSLGFLSSPTLVALLAKTRVLEDCGVDEFDAVVVAGGQSPMFTFRGDAVLAKKLEEFYAAEKPTAALCHGVCALLDLKRADGAALIQGQTITGFSNVEENAVDALMGKRVMPFRIEDEARKLGANFVGAGAWREFAVRDGRLITGQQQYSGRATARLVIEALGL